MAIISNVQSILQAQVDWSSAECSMREQTYLLGRQREQWRIFGALPMYKSQVLANGDKNLVERLMQIAAWYPA